MEVLSIFKGVIDWCWRMFTYDFTVGSFSFSFFDVAVVAVGIWIGSLLWTGIVEGGGE